MKSFLRLGLIFLITLIPLYFIILVAIYHSGTAKYIPNVLDKTKNDGFLLSRLRELPNYKNVDFLFLGSSHACREFDPRIFKQYGFSSFNLGSSAQTPINSQFLFTKYINFVKPKQLIFEVFFFVFGNDGVESAIDIVSNSEIDSHNLSMALSKPNLKTLNTLSFILINRVFQPLPDISEHNLPFDSYISGGYIEKTLPDSINRKLSTISKKRKISIRPEQVHALKKIIEIAKDKNIIVTLVAAPVTQEFLNQFKNYDDFFRLISEVAGKAGIRYIDYNYPATVRFDSRKDFYDSNHLTQKGVEKFNRHLIEHFLDFTNPK